jgi:hypothetical protein
MAVNFTLLIYDGPVSDRISPRTRLIRTGASHRLVLQVPDDTGQAPGWQAYAVRAEGIGDGPAVNLMLIERGLNEPGDIDGPAAA